MACTFTTLYGTTQIPTTTVLLTTLTYTVTPAPTTSAYTSTCAAFDIFCTPVTSYVVVTPTPVVTAEALWTTISTKIVSVVPQQTLSVGAGCGDAAVVSATSSAAAVAASSSDAKSSSQAMTGDLTNQFVASSTSSVGGALTNVGVGQFSSTVGFSASGSSTSGTGSGSSPSSTAPTSPTGLGGGTTSPTSSDPNINPSPDGSNSLPSSSSSSSPVAGDTISNAGSSSSPSSSRHGINAAAVAGGIVGAILALVLLAVLGMLVQRRAARKSAQREDREDYWENRFRELEKEIEEGCEGKGGEGLGIREDGEGEGGEGREKKRQETRKLHLTLDLGSKLLPLSRPASRQSFVSFFTRPRSRAAPPMPAVVYSATDHFARNPSFPLASASDTDSIKYPPQGNGNGNGPWQRNFSRPMRGDDSGAYVDHTSGRETINATSGYLEHPHLANDGEYDPVGGYGYSYPSAVAASVPAQNLSSFHPLQINKKNRALPPTPHTAVGESGPSGSEPVSPKLNFAQRLSARWIPRTTTAGAPPSTPGGTSGYRDSLGDGGFEDAGRGRTGLDAKGGVDTRGRKGMEWIRSVVDDDTPSHATTKPQGSSSRDERRRSGRRNHGGEVVFEGHAASHSPTASTHTFDTRRISMLTVSTMATYAPSGRLPLPPLPASSGRRKSSKSSTNSSNQRGSRGDGTLNGMGYRQPEESSLPPHLRPTSPSSSLSSAGDHSSTFGSSPPQLSGALNLSIPSNQSQVNTATSKRTSLAPSDMAVVGTESAPSEFVPSSGPSAAGSTKYTGSSSEKGRTLYPRDKDDKGSVPRKGSSSTFEPKSILKTSKITSADFKAKNKKAPPPQLQLSPSATNPSLWVNETQLALDNSDGAGMRPVAVGGRALESLPESPDTKESSGRGEREGGGGGGGGTEETRITVSQCSATTVGDDAYGGLDEGSSEGVAVARRGSSPKSLGWASGDSHERSAVTPRLGEKKRKGKNKAVD